MLALTGPLAAQPSLKITSPADSTTVHPGESLTVTVDVSPPGVFEIVAVNAPTPLGKGKQVLKTPPYQFTIQIPSGTRPNKYAVTAVGVTSSMEFIYSHPVEILIERADSPMSISTMDQKRYFQVTGLYADKTTADLTQSSRTKYVSSAPGVATVDARGVVTPVAPGVGKIMVIYGDLKHDVALRVRASER